MLSTRFVSNCTADSIDDLKIAALYFDELQVVEHRLAYVKPDESTQGFLEGKEAGTIVDFTDFVTDEFRAHASLLESEGLLVYVNSEELMDEKIWAELYEKAAEILFTSIDVLWEEFDIEYDSTGKKLSAAYRFDPEVLKIQEQFVDPITIGATVEPGTLARYYGSLLTSLLGSVATGGECVTSSDVLNRLVKVYYESERLTLQRQQLRRELGYSPSWAYEAIKVNLPNVSNFSLEDILDIRHQLNDELVGFRHQIADIHEELLDQYEPVYIATNAQAIVDRKINPSLEDIDKKIRYARTKVLKKLFDELRNPKSYTPLIGTLFDKMPLHITAMVSLGLVGASTALDYVMSMDEIKDNGLYYLIKLRTEGGRRHTTN
jgi:hypothetical protein